MERAITVYGVDTCEDTERTREHLDDLGLDYEYVDLDDNPEADQKVRDANGGKRKTPMLVLRAGLEETVLRVPDNDKLNEELERLRFLHRDSDGDLIAA